MLRMDAVGLFREGVVVDDRASFSTTIVKKGAMPVSRLLGVELQKEEKMVQQCARRVRGEENLLLFFEDRKIIIFLVMR